MSGPPGGQKATAVVERIENDVQRMKRTMHLLIFVGSGFCLCWLPLNVYNTVRVVLNTEADLPLVP